MEGTSAQPVLPMPPLTAPVTSTGDGTPTVITPMPTATVPAAIPALLPIISPGIPPESGPIPPPTMFGQLATVYLTSCAYSSQGIHPTVLQVLPDIVSASEIGTWFVVTVGRYTGIYMEWYIAQFLSVCSTLTIKQASSQPTC